jgi:hypothetical protein
MLDTIEDHAGAEFELGQQLSKRARIEAELRTNSQRSDREIARVLGDGICHKTVGTARTRLGIAFTVGNSPAAPATLEAKTDQAMALINATLHKPPPKPRFNPFDPKEDCMVAAERHGVAVFVNPRNCVVIANGNVRDGIDEIVQVSFVDLPALIAKLQELHTEYLNGLWTPDPYPDDDGGE